MAKSKIITYKAEEEAYWLAQSVDVDTLRQATIGLLGCTRVTMKWNRLVPAGLTDDQIMTHFWFGKIAGGTGFSMVPIAELAAIEGYLDTMFNSLLIRIPDDLTLVEYAWHQFNEDSPRTNDKDGSQKGQKPGPAVRVTTKAIVGTGSGTMLPQQVALNVTLRTASRRHWGRSYMPGGTSSELQSNYGRWSNTITSAWADAVDTLHNTAQAASYQLGVWSQLHPAFLTPKAIETDDVPDIIRRRRAKRAGARFIKT